MTNHGSINRVFQEKFALLWENVSSGKLRRYNRKYLYPKFNGYGGNDETSFKDY
jgi:hypothetical protein